MDIGWEAVESYGASGGILTLWDKSKITVVETIRRRYSLSIKRVTLCKRCCWVTNVYDPCGYRERKLVWPELLNIDCREEAWCLGGDFNTTRWVYERFPVGRSIRE